MRKYWIFLSLSLTPLWAASQPGLDEMQQAGQSIAAWFLPAWECALVLAAILATCGALRVYHNWQMGTRHISGQVAAWFFAALFMLISGIFLKAVFPV